MVMPCSRSALQAVDEQREVDVAALVPTRFESASSGRELVLEDHLAVVEQAADQRALAVVDAAAGDEAQQVLVLMLARGRRRCPGDECVGPGDLGGHQK
jgi:hypothetical protein